MTNTQKLPILQKINFDNLLVIYIVLQPIIDIFTSLCVRNISPNLTLGIFIRTIFMLFIILYTLIRIDNKSRCKLLVYYIFIALYCIIFMIKSYSVYGSTMIITDIKGLVKTFYFPVILASLLLLFKTKSYSTKIKYLNISLVFYVLPIIIGRLLNIGYPTYTIGNNSGTIGLFYAGNELGAILAILAPLCFALFLKNKFSIFNFLFCAITIFTMLEIGTKVACFAAIGLLILAFFIALIAFISNRKKYKQLLGVFAILLTVCLLLSYTSAGKNLGIPSILSYASRHESTPESEEHEKNPYIENPEMLLSGRNLFLQNTLKRYKESSVTYKLVGLGYRNYESDNNIHESKLIEIDYFDVFFCHGIIGTLLFCLPVIIVACVAIRYFLIDFRYIIKNTISYFVIYSIVLGFGIALMAGHVFTAPAVSFNLIILISEAIFIFKLQREEEKHNKIRKISILALHLGFGGIENSICTLANILCKHYDVEIISTYKLLDTPAFKLNSNVKVKYLINNLKPNKKELQCALQSKNIVNIVKEAVKSARILFLKKYKFIQLIKKLDSDIIITTRIIHNAWVGKYAKDGIIKIAEEHNHHNFNNKYIKKLIHSLRNIDYLIPASQELADFYKNKLKAKETKVIYIPAALDMFPEKCAALDTQNIVSIGRLEKEKGFADLIEVFKQIHQANNTCKLKIIGDGSERDYLNDLVKKEHLENAIQLCGFKSKDEISKIMLESSLYLMTSYTESFGLVLLEAESYGIPIVAFDSAQGACEIITSGENGYLVPDRSINKMAEISCDLLNDLNLRRRIGQCGRDHSNQYKKENISKKWLDFLTNINLQ